MDNKLNIEEPMSELRKNASTQLSGVSRLQRFISKGQKGAIGNIIFFSNFNYSSWFGISVHSNHHRK